MSKSTAASIKSTPSMMQRSEFKLSREELHKKLDDKSIDKYKKLEIGIKYLDRIKSKEAAEYIQESREVMHLLDLEFAEQEQYLLWVRYFDISAKKKASYALKKEEGKNKSELEIFRSGIEEIVLKQLMLLAEESSTIDWRIAKKMLGAGGPKGIFPKDAFDGKKWSIPGS